MAILDIPLNQTPPFLRGMSEVNQLSGENIANRIKEIEAQYKPLTTQAEAASKLAYANLMGPQFIAKLFSNPDVVANMKDPQKMLDIVQRAGLLQSGGGIGGAPLTNNISNLPNLTPQNPLGMGGLFGLLLNKLIGSPQQAPSINPLQNPTQIVPTQPVSIQGTQPQTPQPTAPLAQPTKPPEKSENVKFAETSGQAAGIKKEGEESGKIRAQTIDELDQQAQQAIQAEVPLQHMKDIVNNPIFKNMRNMPWFQGLQLNVKSKIGTPEEQRLIGDFQTTAMNAVAQTVMGFRGRILDKEVTMANQMKINPEDTFNVIMGKLPSIMTFNEMTKQRARFAAKLMRERHISRGEALEEADKMVDGNAIRKNVENSLNYNQTSSWPKEKEAVNENEVRGQSAGKDSVWMIRPDGMKVRVHNSNVKKAKEYNFREIE